MRNGHIVMFLTGVYSLTVWELQSVTASISGSKRCLRCCSVRVFSHRSGRVMYEQSIINYLPRPIQSCTTFRVAHEQGYVPAVGLLQIFDDVVWTKFRRTCWSVVVICLRKANMFITVALPRLLYPVRFYVATSSACTSFHHRKTTDKSADRTTVPRLVLHSFKYSR